MANIIGYGLAGGLLLVVLGFVLFAIGYETGWEGLASFGMAVTVSGILIAGLTLAVVMGVAFLYVLLVVGLLIVAAMGLWLILVLLGLVV